MYTRDINELTVESSVRKVLAARPLPPFVTGNVISAVPVIYSLPRSHDRWPFIGLAELTACFRLIGQDQRALSPSPARWLYIIVAKQCCVHEATELECVCVCVCVYVWVCTRVCAIIPRKGITAVLMVFDPSLMSMMHYNQLTHTNTLPVKVADIETTLTFCGRLWNNGDFGEEPSSFTNIPHLRHWKLNFWSKTLSERHSYNNIFLSLHNKCTIINI